MRQGLENVFDIFQFMIELIIPNVVQSRLGEYAGQSFVLSIEFIQPVDLW